MDDKEYYLIMIWFMQQQSFGDTYFVLLKEL